MAAFDLVYKINGRLWLRHASNPDETHRNAAAVIIVTIVLYELMERGRMEIRK